MRRFRTCQAFLVAGLTVLLFSAAANAQPGRGFGGGRGGFGGPGGGFRPTVDRATLLGSDRVKEELKVSEAQAVTLNAALDAYRQEREESRPDRSAFEGLSEQERTAMFEKMRTQREALSKKTDEVINAMLEPEQVSRLDQIALQVRLRSGLAAALKNDDLKQKLTISDDQTAKLDEIEEATREAMREQFQRGGGDRGGDGGARPDFNQIRERMEAARKETETKVMAVLSADQKDKLKSMQGAEFEVDMRDLFGGFGRGGGDRGGDGGGRRRGGDDGGGRRRPQAESESI